ACDEVAGAADLVELDRVPARRAHPIVPDLDTPAGEGVHTTGGVNDLRVLEDHTGGVADPHPESAAWPDPRIPDDDVGGSIDDDAVTFRVGDLHSFDDDVPLPGHCHRPLVGLELPRTRWSRCPGRRGGRPVRPGWRRRNGGTGGFCSCDAPAIGCFRARTGGA